MLLPALSEEEVIITTLSPWITLPLAAFLATLALLTPRPKPCALCDAGKFNECAEGK